MKKKVLVLVLTLTILSGIGASFAGNYDEWGPLPLRNDSVKIVSEY